MSPIFNRSELLLGGEAMDRLKKTKVILFGVGGVGSWCAEALIRTGIQNLTIVDSDKVCITNVNRQLQATTWNVGEVKVDELKKRLLEINPNANIQALQRVYNHETREDFDLASYDYVIDAIDSLSYKIDLLETCMKLGKTIFSSMGAACKVDPTGIQVASIWKTQGCPLAREVRKRIRKHGVEGDFLCVYGEEVLENQGEVESGCGTGQCLCPKSTDETTGEDGDIWCSQKARINGSLVHITGIFGFTLAGLVIQDLVG